MIFDLLQNEPGGHAEWDVCIVGAGAAGIALAVELVRHGQRVLLLEGGGASIEKAAQEPYASEAAFLPYRGLHTGRFRALGGTTTRWGGQILELDEMDFEPRAWVAVSGWPFPKSELREWYRRACEVEGIGAAQMRDERVWRTLGVPEPCFEELESYLSRWCPEPDFSRLHRATLHGPNMEVWLHANATNLIFDGDRAVGVRTRSQSGREAIFRAPRFVFCLGAIESNRFFLQPREGGLPWNASGLLGRNFQDHIDCNVGEIRPKSLRTVRNMFDGIFAGGFKYQPKIKLAAAEQRKRAVLNVAATLAYESVSSTRLAEIRTHLKHLLHRRFDEVDPKTVLSILRYAPAVLRQSARYAVSHRSFQPDDARISLRVHCEQDPCSASSISLSSDRDSLGLFRTRLDWRISALEMRTIRYMTEIVRDNFKSFAEVLPVAGFDDDQALISKCEDSFHHMGGMRMDASSAYGVVDTDLKLHGVTNTWICSSAVFPTSGFSNPTHTLLALTCRLAAHLVRS